MQAISKSTIAPGILFAGLAILGCWNAMHAAPPVDGGGVSNLDLQGQLEKGLMARRPVEFAYIKQIVALVNTGKLPRTLVTSTFGWARQQPNRKLQYFQFALQARAKSLDVHLPDLKDQAVGVGSNGGQHGFG